jgi:hypothetical protein
LEAAAEALVVAVEEEVVEAAPAAAAAAAVVAVAAAQAVAAATGEASSWVEVMAEELRPAVVMAGEAQQQLEAEVASSTEESRQCCRLNRRRHNPTGPGQRQV